LFRSLDYPLWRLCGHNPVKQMQKVDHDRLQAAANDKEFLEMYDSVISALDREMSSKNTWFHSNCGNKLSRPVAFFSAEFAIHNSLPIYSGGLGILAGDMCKEASDIGLPMIGVGLMYPRGYFHQHMPPHGWQEDILHELDLGEMPIRPVYDSEGKNVLAQVELDNRTVSIGAWVVRVGRTNIYLIQTDLEENSIEDRQLGDRIYAADRELRIQQEIILGVGGVRMLRSLGISPEIWHSNEGHTSFMMVERIRECMQGGATFSDAVDAVKSNTVFTTHTPVPAGHDVFQAQLVEKYFRKFCDSAGIQLDDLLRLSKSDGACEFDFNMTALGLRMSHKANAVSALHEGVSKKMWHCLRPEEPEEAIPISHVTNGVHLPSWLAPEFSQLYSKHLGKSWALRHDDPEIWKSIRDIDSGELWLIHQDLKKKLLGLMRERAHKQFAENAFTPEQLLALGVFLHPDVLTIGYVRRFVDYKRPTLILHNYDRIRAILTNRDYPVQIIFAGKSHQADDESKQLLQRVYTAATDRQFQGRIAFVEDYDMHIARYLTQGVDVWLNNPRRLHEACGTSGMKAAMNGVPNLSVRDGWWNEGYRGNNGWAIGSEPGSSSMENEDEADVESIYQLLEQEIVPLYYDRDRMGMPLRWIEVIKEAIFSAATSFCTRRMMKEYIQLMYLPSLPPRK